MTLDELLALLPDNTSGAIDAVDLRTIVTELHTLAMTVVFEYAYDWTTDVSPAVGKMATTPGWSMSATTLILNETTADGALFPFPLLDRSTGATLLLTVPDGAGMRALVAGDSVDQGGYRSLPITPQVVNGATPTNNTLMTLTLIIPPDETQLELVS